MQNLIPNPNPSPYACGPHHRRAHSDPPFRVPDDLGPGDLFTDGLAGADLRDFGSEDDLFHMYLDMANVGAGSEVSPDPIRQPKHRHSLSVGGFGCGSAEARKAMVPEKLAELAIVDPKRVKRILANRQSAARSKERKARYISELEMKVQSFQFELTTLSAQLALLQRDTAGLATENHELKLRLQVIEHQSQLQDALNGALKNEAERLKFATGEAASHANTYNMGLQQFPPNESLVRHHHQEQQQQFSFHQSIQSPRPQFPQPQPTFSNHQILFDQHRDNGQIPVDTMP